jgi:hypothetical protein
LGESDSESQYHGERSELCSWSNCSLA